MLDKLYPKDQIKNYLLIDFVLIVFLFYRVLRLDGALGLWSSLMLLLLFLVSFYFALWRRDGGLLAAVLSGLFVLAVLAVYIGPVILWFGFIFADLLGRSRSKGHIAIGSAGIALSFMFVFIIRMEPLLQISNAVYLPVMIIQTVYPIVIYIKEKSKSLQGELDAANEQIAKYIQQEERQRIARDLHDILGQTLMMIKLKSELATKWVDKDTAQAKRELGDILATSRTAIKQVRELVSEMKFISLPGELEHSVELLRTAGIALYIEYHGKTPLLSSVEETMLSLCVREATTNIIKHSGAKRCTIMLEVKEQSYVIHITDDGKGVTQQEGGNGIPSMVERMQILGGSFAICPSPAGGTVLSLKLPIHQHEKEDDS